MLPIARFLKAGNVRLGLAHGHLDGIDPEREAGAERRRLKDEVIEELIDLFMGVNPAPDAVEVHPEDRLMEAAAGRIANRSKFSHDFRSREAKSSTALAGGLAIPHVRSQQTKQFTFVFARSRDGVWYDAPDGEPTRLFFCISAPPWENEWYLNFYQWLGGLFKNYGDWLPGELLEAETADEIVALLAGLD